MNNSDFEAAKRLSDAWAKVKGVEDSIWGPLRRLSMSDEELEQHKEYIADFRQALRDLGHHGTEKISVFTGEVAGDDRLSWQEVGHGCLNTEHRSGFMGLPVFE